MSCRNQAGYIGGVHENADIEDRLEEISDRFVVVGDQPLFRGLPSQQLMRCVEPRVPIRQSFADFLPQLRCDRVVVVRDRGVRHTARIFYVITGRRCPSPALHLRSTAFRTSVLPVREAQPGPGFVYRAHLVINQPECDTELADAVLRKIRADSRASLRIDNP